MSNYINLGTRILGKGNRGTDVELLQTLLKILPDPMGTEIKEFGIFGDETEKAVKKYQKYFNLKIDGMVGRETYLYLGILTGSYLPLGARLFGSRTLAKGNRGYDVWVLQNRLATTAEKFSQALGGPATAIFDNNTEKAVKMFQNDTHLNMDGMAGPKTVYQIYFYGGMGGRYLQKGRPDRDGGYDVYWLQRHLAGLNYYHGRWDGRFGPLTEEAVKNLQEAKGLEADGIVGAPTYYHLASY